MAEVMRHRTGDHIQIYEAFRTSAPVLAHYLLPLEKFEGPICHWLGPVASTYPTYA